MAGGSVVFPPKKRMNIDKLEHNHNHVPQSFEYFDSTIDARPSKAKPGQLPNIQNPDKRF